MLIDFEGDECIGECGDEGRGFARRKFVMMVVMNYLRKSTASSFAREVKSAVDVISLVGRMEWNVWRINILITGLDMEFGWEYVEESTYEQRYHTVLSMTFFRSVNTLTISHTPAHPYWHGNRFTHIFLLAFSTSLSRFFFRPPHIYSTNDTTQTRQSTLRPLFGYRWNCFQTSLIAIPPAMTLSVFVARNLHLANLLLSKHRLQI